MKHIEWGVLLILMVIFLSWINQKTETVTIGFAGDTMLGRLMNTIISQKGYAYPWGDLLPLLNQTDFNIINLETTFTTSEKKLPKIFNFKSDPSNVQSLNKANISLVNLANNHILDFGNEGLTQTIHTLDASDIQHVGAGKNLNQAKQAVIFSKNNIKIGIIGYTDYNGSWKAKINKPGVNYIKIGDVDSLQQEITTIRPQVDILIITIHWGPNMRQYPSQKFIHFAHAMIDSGVDIVHGHSAHILQGIELYKNGLIMYDTGDFVDDYAVDPVLRNDQSLFIILTVSKTGIKKIELVPLLISNFQVNRAKGSIKNKILDRVKTLSAQFKTKIKKNHFNSKKNELEHVFS